MPKPRVTILMLTCGRAEFIGAALESAAAQTFEDWELIIVDDQSTDGTREIVADWLTRDVRIRYLRRELRGRIANASNFGLREVKGNYIAILDDDDRWADPEKLAKQVNFLDTYPDHVGVGGGYISVDVNGNELGRYRKFETDEEIKKSALLANPMANSTTMFRMDTAKSVGLYDESLLQFADWDFWLKMGLAGKLYNFPDYFTFYLMWGAGSSFSRQKENAASALVIVKRYRGKYRGFFPAYLLARAYIVYAYFPPRLKRALNPLLSGVKKSIFSRPGS